MSHSNTVTPEHGTMLADYYHTMYPILCIILLSCYNNHHHHHHPRLLSYLGVITSSIYPLPETLTASSVQINPLRSTSATCYEADD